MMYKRLYVLLLVAFMCIIFPVAGLTEDAGQASGKSDVLLLFDKGLTEQAHENVASVADILTYMGYSVSYKDVNESKGSLHNFSHIIFYHESDEIEQAFLDELGQTDCKIMVVGGGEISKLLKALNLPVNYNILEDMTSQITYSFDGENEISFLAKSQSTAMFQGDFPYSSGTVVAGGTSSPYSVREGRFVGIAAYDGGSKLLRAMLTQQIALWKWPYNDAPHSFPQYIIFDEVYPFFDTNKMMAVIDMMKKMNIPYAITVMPIYQNGEYPAMKHFCEVLRYAQANGAAIILRTPNINVDKPTEKDINKRISIAFSSYSSYGVYPIALEAPDNWIHETMGLNVMRRFRTIVLTPDQKSSWSEEESNNSIYADGHQLIAPAISNEENGSSLISVHPTAVFLNMLSDLEDLRAQVQKVSQSKVPLKSLWLSSHSVYTDDKVLNFMDGVLTMQGKTVGMEYTPFQYDENYKYNRGVIGRMADTFKSTNRKLIITVCGISALFIIFIVIARRQSRRKFLYR